MIAIDWGSSNLRAWRLDGNGRIRDQRRAELGALGHGAAYPERLGAVLDGWDDAELLVCGMAGARGGWREAPYVPCPATPAALAAALLPVATEGSALHGRRVRIVPGVSEDSGPVPDVMRGEETQIVGLLPALGPGRHRVCLPGTHSKWAQVEDGCLLDFATIMTGELYALLRRHSTLGRLMQGPDTHLDEPAFALGVARSGQPGGIGQHLFGTRALGLFERLPATALASYLSGILIGHEIRSRQPIGERVHLVASAGLAQRYAQALALLGIASTCHGEDLAAAGLYRLQRLSAERAGAVQS